MCAQPQSAPTVPRSGTMPLAGRLPLTGVDERVVRRVVGAAALTAVALTHAVAIFASGRLPSYLIAAMMLAAIAAVVVSGALVLSGRLITWRAAGTLTVVTLLGYTVDHTVGLPGAGQGIGHGVAPLGLVSVGLELLVLALAAVAIARWDD